ncbi:STAS/SEC14 domain-containing protein [Halovenus salina]|uniref:STAS/SEC14 domain-containing protein n=1 Tax=Halovenus salina TaxID=1510225 RepID=A0ABD5W1B5_9EURY|nr:STAS/SEC14 domain-containing protein [Halovenus salina]
MKRSGDSWSLEYDDGVVIGRFREGMPLSAFETGAYPAFEAICAQHSEDIIGTADLVELDDALGTEVLDIWEQAAQESSQLPNYRRGALVADGITNLSLKNKLRVPNAEIKGFENLDDAIAWARGED